ncbi:putative GMP synthase (glutamine-hydrolyzing) [Rosa chinensis]|uniref:Putative GMP synthase (Glutamine-hydrolyzing) n=1 Tax=Rosa chinensis TaxID=74649 RepID=A0A2P6SHL7_ROSCH|nr:putative GMP synthase (glutamine-hydrolyzing) [Rosa chinensis]
MARWRLWWRAIRGFSRPKRVGDRQVVWMSHGDEVAKLPQGFRVMAQSQQGVVAAREWRFYGLQYHPESQCFAHLRSHNSRPHVRHGLHV